MQVLFDYNLVTINILPLTFLVFSHIIYMQVKFLFYAVIPM
jgi:hypothetical protein